VARNIVSIINHGVGVEASFSVRQDVIWCRQSKSTGETLRKNVVVRKFAWANNRVPPGDDPVLDPTSTVNDMEMKREAEQKKLHQMAKVHDILEMSQGSQSLRATQKGSRAETKQMRAVGYIPDTEEIDKASWSHFQHDGAAAFELLETSPVPPASSAKDIPGGPSQVLNVHLIKQINRHPAESDEESSPESISDTENWLNWNGDLDNPNYREDDWEAENESDMELDNGSEDSESLEQRDVNAVPNVPGLFWPIQQSKKKAEKTLIIVNITETRRNMGIKN